MEIKSHYKMFKAGKLWMTALVSVAVLGAAQVAHADQTDPHTSQPASDLTQTTSSTANANGQTVTLAAHSGQESSSQSLPVSAPAQQNVAQDSQALTESKAKQTTPQSVRTADAQGTMDLAESTITVTNPTNYPTQAAWLVGSNQQGQPYYIFQIVNLVGSQINGRQARMILAVDPQNPQETVYLYVTDDQYSRAFRTVAVASNAAVNISVGTDGNAIPNATSNQFYKVRNTAPYTYNFNGTTLSLPASLSIKTNSSNGSTLRVAPVYGLGNQQMVNFNDKVDISPENTAPAIEYVYKDKNGNYTTNINFPANVPVNGITGQQFTVTNIDNYKQVIPGYYLTNQYGSMANGANGTYTGTISQFQLGKSYQKTLYNWNGTISQRLIYTLINPDGTMNISQIKGNSVQTVTVAAGSFKQFTDGTYARNPFVPGANSVQLIYADLGHIIPVDENGNVISTNQPIYNNDPNDPHKAATTASPDLTAEGWVLQTPSQAEITPADPGADTKVVYVRAVTNQEEFTITQTVRYEYADGITAGRPALPATNVQQVTFTHTIVTNPITGDTISDTWSPWSPSKPQQFSAVTTPELTGFTADQEKAGGNDSVTHETPSQTYVVKYYGPSETVEHEQVTQTVRYEYVDGETAGRPALPANNVQTLNFTRTIKRDSQGNIISDTWEPSSGNFTMVQTPEIAGFVPSANWAGSTAVVEPMSPDFDYVVQYAPMGDPITTTKTITQTVHYQYADGNTEDNGQARPALPADNVQTVSFLRRSWINPFTGNEYRFEWEPDHATFNLVQTPTIAGYYADLAEAGYTSPVLPTDNNFYYVVNYAAPLTQQVEQRKVTQTVTYAYEDGITDGRPALPQTDYQELIFNRVQLINPYTKEVISDTWTPAQRFVIVKTPTIPGFYYDLAQAGSDALVTHESPNTAYEVLYFAPNELTEEKTVKQVIKYVYADGITEGRPALPADNVQTLTFTRTNRVNPNNPNEVVLGQWTPASGHFTIVKSPLINGFTYDLAEAGSDQLVTGDSADTEYLVQYLPAPEEPKPDEPTPDQPTPGEPTTPDQPGTTVPDDQPTIDHQPADNKQPIDQAKLPQTGSQFSAGLTILGLAAGMLGFGLGKRKQH